MLIYPPTISAPHFIGTKVLNEITKGNHNTFSFRLVSFLAFNTKSYMNSMNLKPIIDSN
uniref:Uncharacterized protein n=1 Tax=Rhizophora mucronata TaxID=61149 RepID=A0A2P2ITK2_RHIMU